MGASGSPGGRAHGIGRAADERNHNEMDVSGSEKVLVMPTVGFVAAYRRAAHPIGSKMKNADVPTVNREAEENWGK